MMKRIITIALACMAALTLAACGSTPSSGSAPNAPESKGDAPASSDRQTINFDINTGSITPYSDTTIVQIGHVNPGTDEDFLTSFCHNLSDELMTRSDGKYAIEVMSDSVLGNESAMLEGLQMGTIDAAIISNMTFSASVDVSNIIELPFIFDSIEKAADFVGSEEMMQPIFDALESQFGIHCNTYCFNGFRKTMSAKAPITTLDEFKGVKIRVPESTIFNETFKNLGANPTALAFSECFTALQQGTVDAMELPIASIYSTSLDSVAPSISATNHVFTSCGICFSGSFWNSLSAEDQAVFDASLKAAQALSRSYVQEYEQSMIDAMVERGATYIADVDVAPFQEAVKPVYDMYVNIIGEEYYTKATQWLAAHK